MGIDRFGIGLDHGFHAFIKGKIENHAGRSGVLDVSGSKFFACQSKSTHYRYWLCDLERDVERSRLLALMGVGMSDGVIVGIVTGSVTLLVTLFGGVFKNREMRLSGNTNEQTRFFDRLEKDLEAARADVKDRDARIEKLESDVFELRLTIQRLLLKTTIEIKPGGEST